MKMFNINGDHTLYTAQSYTNARVRVVSTKHAGFPPMSEAELLEMLAAALRDKEELDKAIVSIRALLQTPGVES